VNADLFVSIHADAVVHPRARGSSVYVLSDRGASSVEARWLASKENSADLVGGVDLRTRNKETAQLLMELMTTSQIRDSRKFAASVLSELGDIGTLHKPDVEQASFAVLKAPDVPSILVETAFISNPEEEMKLRSPRYQDQVATAIVRGIRVYFKENPPGPRGKVL
jgi:N-acetylmuramoyl-L-alanine amidase